MNAAIPLTSQGKLDSCKLLSDNDTLIDCNSWVYDTRYYTSSRGIEWNFVCSRRWMGAAAQSIFMTGVVIGSLVLGPLCDKFGRKTVFLWAALGQLICSVAVAFTTNYYSFVVVRFLYGISAVSPFKAGYVLTIELVGPSKRAVCGALFQILFGTGVMLVGFWAYLIDNRFYLQIVYGLHTALLIPHWFLLDESPRWLWAKGRPQQATAIVEKALKINNSRETVDVPLLVSHYKALHQEKDTYSYGIPDLFRTPNMIRKSLIISGCWLAVAVVYYGLSFNTGKLNGNPFLIMFLSGFVELPGYGFAMYFVQKAGNRAILSITMILSGLSCLATVFLRYDSTSITVAAMIGKSIISGSFAVIYKYTAELFPTVVRSSGVGFGTMCASLSAALSPLITLLDSFNPKIPTVVFGLLSLLFGSFALLLPETLGRKLPQTLEDGENFGKGDTCFTNCNGRRSSDSSIDSSELVEPVRVIHIVSKEP